MTTKQITKNTETTDSDSKLDDETDELPDWNELNNRLWRNFVSDSLFNMILFVFFIPAFILTLFHEPTIGVDKPLSVEIIYSVTILIGVFIGNYFNRISKSTIILLTVQLLSIFSSIFSVILVISGLKHGYDLLSQKYKP